MEVLFMEELLEQCCGIDVHRDSLTACIMVNERGKVRKEIRTYTTMTDDIEALGVWLRDNGIKQVGIESTGIYWKPIFNILDGEFEIILANARNIKNVPGRKTDVKDSEWICKLLKNGLVEKSFIPPEDMRHLRNFTRYRKKIVEEITREKNRIIKLLEDANIKLASVLSDVYGKTGWNIIKKIASGESNPKELASELYGPIRKSPEEIERALNGRVTSQHREMMKLCVDHIEYLEANIEKIDQQIDILLTPYQEEKKLLETIPGIKDIGAATIIAEIGVDMSHFPSADHLASWTGVSPGNNESAGKKKAEKQLTGINI